MRKSQTSTNCSSVACRTAQSVFAIQSGSKGLFDSQRRPRHGSLFFQMHFDPAAGESNVNARVVEARRTLTPF